MDKYFFTCIVLLLSSLCMAESSSQHNHSDTHELAEQKAHLHGFAELTLALVGNSLEINLESPAANIVGFEHKATSKEQIQALENAKSALESAKQLFTFFGSKCAPKHAHADMSALIQQDEHHHDDHHEEGHHGEEKHEAHEEGHSEIKAIYSFECQQGNKLDTVSVNLIQLFPSIEKLNVMWLTDNFQGSVELNSVSNLIHIR